MTQVIQNSQPTLEKKKKNTQVLPHNFFSKVAMVTILEVLLWLPVIIRISLKEHPNILHLHDGFTALMIACSQQLTVIGYF